MGAWESTGTLEPSENDYRDQNTSHWGVFLYHWKFKCLKWVHIAHLDICNTSYGKKKCQESNCQFDSWAQKVGNRPDPVRVGGGQHTVGKFSTKATTLRRWRSEQRVIVLQSCGSPNLGSFKTPPLGVLGQKCHLDVGAAKRRGEYHMGEGGGFPQVRAMVSLVSLRYPVACFSIKGDALLGPEVNPLEGSPNVKLRKLGPKGALPASNSRKG
jgi:hypothetical protein